MAELTSDIVWLVEQSVTLADGSTQRVLVPQVYVRVKPGDIDGGGALLSANALHITTAPGTGTGTGNVTNTGTLAGRTLVAITADNVDNLGGRIVGGSVGLNARNDLNNIGGSIEARNAAVLTAGHDINIRTTTSSQSGAQGSRTAIDRVAGVYVTNPGGTLVASAGNDVNLVGAILSNTGTGSQTLVSAANDINLGTVKTARSEDITWDAKNYRRAGDSQEIGSQIAGAGDITLQAGRDVNARAATVAAEGALGVLAGRDVTIEAGRSTQSLDEASYSKSSDALSSTATTRRDSYRSDTAAGSSLGGNSVAISAGKDIRITGSEVIADERLTLAAANNITIEASTQTASESHFLDEKKSGVFGSGGIGFTIGSQQQSTDQQTGSTRAAASTVGSVGGDVVIVAGNAYRQTGSDVLAPAGDVTILAKKVDIVEARETSRTDTEQKQRTGGLTIAITAPIVSAVQSLGGTARAVADTGSDRMKALGAASMAMEAKGIADAVMQNPSQAMGVNLAISIGGSKSQSNRVETSDSARGSSVAAGGNLTIAALGGGQDSNLLIRGSDIKAGTDATLAADNRIDILAAENDWAQHSTNKASAASIGVSFGTSGFLVNASASASKGRSDGTETSYTNSHVNAGERVTLVSGGDTTIRGGVITADKVRADIGGNLAIESLQDRAKSDSKQQSAGGSLSVGAGVWSASANMSSAKAKGDYASVTEQSGIRAGDGGFDVNVKGNTDLKGGVISSTQAATDGNLNSLTTGTLTTSDIVNRDSHKASGTTLGVGLSGGSDKDGNALPTRTGGSAGTGKASGSQASVTRSGISGMAGDETVRTGTDTTRALTKTWNTDTLVKDVQAQAQITQGFGQQATSAWGKFANGKLADALQSDDKEAVACWSAGGACRVAGHSVIGGLTGDAGGAMGAAASTALVPYLGQMATSAGLSGAAHDAVVTGLASAVGGALGGSAGAAASFNEVNNNYLTSGQWKDFAEDIARCKARSCTTEEQQAIRTSYQELSNQQNIALAKCAHTGNCVTLRDEVTHGTQTMLDLAGAGKLPIGAAPGNDLGQYAGQRLANDPAYRDRVNQSIAVLDNCKANPQQCNEQAVRAAALVVFPLLGPAGVPLAAEALLAGGSIGAAANIAGQAYSRVTTPVAQRKPIDWGDATTSAMMAAYTGALTYGASFWSSLFMNTGGAVVTSAVSSDPSAAGGGIAGAAFGTAIGYPLGAAVQGGMNGVVNHWSRPLWRDRGYTIQQWVGPSPLPGMRGAGAGSFGQEFGSALVNGQTSPSTPAGPTRAGQ